MSSSASTIVAVSSPPGRSARGLVRLAGAEAAAILRALTDLAHPPRPHTITTVRLHSPLPALPVLVSWYQGPRSYTGDDLAEIQLPGNPALLSRVVHGAIAAGARLAEPGEFTFRAFTAGKLDLTQAEGVAATIAAVSDGQLKAAAMLRQGKLAAIATELVDGIAQALALVEAGIDFVDQEDVVAITPADLHDRLKALDNQLSALLARSRSWSALEGLPRVVLVGAPSAGKSTLFNALLGRQRAVVHATPGTTRDVLAEPMRLSVRDRKTSRDREGAGLASTCENAPLRSRLVQKESGREVMLVDIAGLDEPAAALDVQIQAAALAAIEGADLLLVLEPLDSSNNKPQRAGPSPAPVPPPAAPLPLQIPRDVAYLLVQTKADLVDSSARPPSSALAVSAVTGQGVDDLRRAIADHLGQRAVSVASQMLALQPRHEHALRATGTALAQARDLVGPQRDEHQLADMELIATALRITLDELASLGGRLTADDVIGRIFATFCVGK